MKVEFELASCPAEELSLIASAISDPAVYREWSGKLGPDGFSDSTRNNLWRLLGELDAGGTGYTSHNVLTRWVHDNPAVGSAFFADLPIPLEIGSECLAMDAQAVIEAARMRKIQLLGASLATSWAPGAVTSETLGGAMEVVHGLDEQTTQQGAERMIDVALRVAKSGVASEAGTPTGWPTFDKRVGGLFPGRLYVVGARPSCGKTACAVTWALAAGKAGAHVLLLTTETSKEVMASRGLGQMSGEDSFKIRTGTSNPSLVIEGLRSMPDTILVEDAAMSIREIRAMITWMRRVSKGNVVIVVDYLELIRPDKQNPSREQEVSRIIQVLHGEAKRHKVAIVVCSQLSRKADELPKKMKDAGPSMSDLRYSGMIEQAADCIVLLHRVDDRDSDILDVKGRVAKNKISGAEFGMELRLIKSTSVLGECSNGREFGYGTL